MLARIFTTITLCAGLTMAPALASDWVEDDQLNGFYKHQVNKSGQPDPSYQPVPNRKPQYRTLGGPQNSSPSVFDTSNGYGGSSAGSLGSMGSGNSGSMGSFASPLTVPARPSQYESSSLGTKPKKRGFFSKLGGFGKSVAQLPADAVEGAGAMLSSPLFWQSAGALAGAGANAYMAHQYYRNNPGLYNPYYGGFGGAGFNPYYGTPGMGFGGLGYGGLGYGGLYGNRGFGNYGGLGYGGLYGGRGFGNYGLGYGGLYGGRGFGNYGLGYGGLYGGRGFGGFGATGRLNSFGSLAPNTPYSNAFRNNYNRQVNNSGLSNYEKYWLRKNPNYSLFGY